MSQSLNLSDWLSLLESRHPVEIELGLVRVSEVAKRLDALQPAPTIITVAGTNGKGSCIALMEAYIRAKGLKVGAYTSPHLIKFNERITVNGVEASDKELCDVFAQVEQARLNPEPISLSYFEFTTLGALQLFKNSSLDVVLLEIGLGGRLDAVNIVDADIAIVTSIALDHQDWLGNDINFIGGEKAAIASKGKPLIYGDIDPVEGVLIKTEQQAAVLFQNGVEFKLDQQGFTCSNLKRPVSSLQLLQSSLPPQSLACALQAIALLFGSLSNEMLDKALNSLVLAGRFQTISYQNKTIIVDVAHNPAAANRLATLLKEAKTQGSVVAIFAVMQDKDITGVIEPLKPLVDHWVLPPLDQHQRAASPHELQTLLYNAHLAASIPSAFEKALTLASGNDDIILVCGSFFLAGPVLAMLQIEGDKP